MEYKEIKLRAPEPEDLELLYLWENKPEIWLLGSTIQPFSKHTLRKYLESASRTIFEEGQLRLMIDKKEDNSTIGCIDLFDFDPVNMRAGVGILIAKKEERNRGYATMALECLIEYSKTKLQLKQLWCNILEDNRTSIKLFTGLDFKLVGIKQQWIRAGEEFKNELLFQLILR
ncbi:MAG: GNAT family N-acetyltransferase [Marinilabiliaceae bacterium]|nr:GNAT family N-acetyltransferase [Marinilabiliaceae bacterium]